MEFYLIIIGCILSALFSVIIINLNMIKEKAKENYENIKINQKDIKHILESIGGSDGK